MGYLKVMMHKGFNKILVHIGLYDYIAIFFSYERDKRSFHKSYLNVQAPCTFSFHTIKPK